MLFVGCDDSKDDKNKESSSTTEISDSSSSSSTSEDVKMASLPYTVTDDLNLNAENTVDEETVTLKAGKYLMILELLDGTVDSGAYYNNVRTYIYNQDDDVIYSAETNDFHQKGGFTHIPFTATTDGDYKIKIYSETNDDVKYKYTLYSSVKNGLVQDAEGEVNDVRALATPITTAVAEDGITGSLNILKTDTADWYDLNITKTGTYLMKLQLLDGTVDSGYYYKNVRTYIYNQDDEVMYSAETNDFHQKGGFIDITFKANVAGSYKILLYSETNDDVKYKFNIYPTIANGLVQDDKHEVNDIYALATPIELDKIINGVDNDINVNSLDRRDYYVLNIVDTGTYNVTLALLDGTVDSGYYYKNVRTYIYNQDDEVIYSTETNDFHQEGDLVNFDFTANASGNYHVLIYSETNDDVFYNLKIEKK